MSQSVLIKNGLVFDGTGQHPVLTDVLCQDGVIKYIGKSTQPADSIIDADGKWVTPGLLDIHTHYDLEVEVDPRLPESVRHGTTTVVMSNCSLGVAFGKQKNPNDHDEDPIVDCFARVENMPKDVIRKSSENIDWTDTQGYLDHFKDMPLGPNVVPMIPHSMLRIEAMGLQDSISRSPTEVELDAMQDLLEKAMQQGYVGMSVDLLPLHYLANDPHKNACIPTQHASYAEIKRLANVVRQHDGILQATPNPDNLLATFKLFLLTSGLLHGKTLKTTATAAMDLRANKLGSIMILLLSNVLNSWLFKGNIVFQALSSPFKVFGDGATCPLMEESEAFRELISVEIEDEDTRRKIMADPAFVERFKSSWNKGKQGFSISRLKHKFNIDPDTFNRDLKDIYIDTIPYAQWNGLCLQDIYGRVIAFQSSAGQKGYAREEEKELLNKFPSPIDEATVFLTLLKAYDRQFRWHTTTANHRPEKLRKLLFHPKTLPGFNDSGAHLTNMAFYDGNLRTLKMAQAESLDLVSQAVSRLTREPAALFGLDVGVLKVGSKADLAIINPQQLKAYDSNQNTQMLHRSEFGQQQMVNRSNGVVEQVLVAGKLAWSEDDFSAQFGTEKYGDVLLRTA